MATIIISSTKKEGQFYCIERGIDTKQAMFITGEGHNGRGRCFRDEDDVHCVDPQMYPRSLIEAVVPCFMFRTLPLPAELQAVI